MKQTRNLGMVRFCIALVTAIAGSLVIGSAKASDLSLSASEPVSTLYNWVEQHCESEFIPDAPARAFRRADNQVALIATHRTNWVMVGPDILSVRPSCNPILKSVDDTQDIGRLWIEGTYTLDGRSIFALVSQDLSVFTKKSGCSASAQPGKCWLNRIISASSNDMGQSFRLYDHSHRTMVTLGDVYPADAKARFGAFTTTNIVKKDQYYYTIVFVRGFGPHDSGNCLFRTANVEDPESWRAWDGEKFSVDMRAVSSNSCAKITEIGNEFRSLSYVTAKQQWVSVFIGRYKLEGDSKPVPGFYYSLSSDLITWSGPKRIMTAPIKPREDRQDQFWYYPSLIDPNSKSRNFETIDGPDPVLFFTVTHLRNGAGSMNRDLAFVKVKIK